MSITNRFSRHTLETVTRQLYFAKYTTVKSRLFWKSKLDCAFAVIIMPEKLDFTKLIEWMQNEIVNSNTQKYAYSISYMY